MSVRAVFLAAVLGYRDTPFLHQGRLPGLGLDCAGVVVCAALAAGLPVRDQDGYPPSPDGDRFTGAVAEHCDRIAFEALRPGDLVTFAFLRRPQHLAVVTSLMPLRIVHAWQDAGRVVENDVDAYWIKRLRGCWRLKGID